MSGAVSGIYAAYLSGKMGHGLAMLLFSHGRIAGADAFGVKFDGSYSELEDGNVSVEVEVASPPNIPLLQGVMTGEHGDSYIVKTRLPADFAKIDYVPFITNMAPSTLG